jgi:hypothetical protein
MAARHIYRVHATVTRSMIIIGRRRVVRSKTGASAISAVFPVGQLASRIHLQLRESACLGTSRRETL